MVKIKEVVCFGNNMNFGVLAKPIINNENTPGTKDITYYPPGAMSKAVTIKEVPTEGIVYFEPSETENNTRVVLITMGSNGRSVLMKKLKEKYNIDDGTMVAKYKELQRTVASLQASKEEAERLKNKSDRERTEEIKQQLNIRRQSDDEESAGRSGRIL